MGTPSLAQPRSAGPALPCGWARPPPHPCSSKDRAGGGGEDGGTRAAVRLQPRSGSPCTWARPGVGKEAWGGGVSGVQKGAERRRRRGPGLTGRCHGGMRGAFTRASRAHTAGSAACGVGPRPGSPLSGRGGEWKGGRDANRVFGLGVEAGQAHRPRTLGQAREQPLGAGPPPAVLVCCESRG